MKLDKDLIRDILLAIEERETPNLPFKLSIPERTDVEVSYHVQILEEAGLLVALERTTMSSHGWLPIRLTYDGHEYIETIRDSEVWRHTKEIAKTAGASTVKGLLEIGTAYVKQKLAELGIHVP